MSETFTLPSAEKMRERLKANTSEMKNALLSFLYEMIISELADKEIKGGNAVVIDLMHIAEVFIKQDNDKNGFTASEEQELLALIILLKFHGQRIIEALIEDQEVLAEATHSLNGTLSQVFKPEDNDQTAISTL